MSAEQLFSIANTIVLPGWIAVAVFPRWRWADRFVVGIVVTLLAGLYAYLLFSNLKPADFRSFSTLGGIAALFSNPFALLAGWVHYLAFDLMIGLFIVSNAHKHRVPHWVALLCALGAFFAGPVGLLLYLLVRFVRTRRYFAENYQP